MRPRIRSIKPQVALDEDLWDLGERTGLPVYQAFTMLWCHADRDGRFEWRPRALKAGCLPFWEGDFERVLDALRTRGFLVKYAILGREYGLVRTFTQHQSINGKEPRSDLPEPTEESVIPITSRVNHALATGEERDGDASIPSVPFRSLPFPSEGGAGGNPNVAHPLPPDWSPPFEEFVALPCTATGFAESLVNFRAHHVNGGTADTETGFRRRLATWASKDHHERLAANARHGSGGAPKPRQPDGDFDVSKYTLEDA